jgi:hypothetical protein
MAVRPIAEHTQVPYDLIVVATLDASGVQSANLLKAGVPREKLCPLRQDVAVRRRSKASDKQSNGQARQSG